MIQPVLTYESDVLLIKKSRSQNLLCTEIMYWRRCFSLSLLNHVRNETKLKNTIMNSIGEKQLKWY